MPKQLNVNLAFTADTSKASQQLSALQKQLSQLTSGLHSNSGTKILTKDIQDATNAAAKLQQQLQAATNVNTGKLDLVKFQQSLNESNMSLQKYQEQLSSLGVAGEQAFNSVAQAVLNAEMPIRRSNALLTEFKTTLMNTARWQISSSILHGFIGSIQSAVGYAKDLNESLNNIRIVTGQSIDQMASFADQANKAAKALSTSTLNYTNASLIYYQQGLNDREVAERTEATLKLANVSRQSAEEVSNQMTAIWNNFDNGTKSLEYYADAITALGAKTASSSAEIAQGLSKFAAVADTIGLSYETATAALATVVAETRQSADTVGTAFKALFSRIESLKLGETLEDGVGLTKYTQALQTVGVQVLDINGNLKDADTILEELGERWNQISRSQQVALAQTVAGQRQYTQMVALMENWDKVTANKEIAAGSEGTLQNQQDIYAESWEAASKRVQAAIQSIYQDLLDDKFFIGFLNNTEKVISFIDRLIDNLGGLKGVAANLGAILTNVFSKDIANNINNMVYGFNQLTGKNVKTAADLKKDAANAMSLTGQDASTESARVSGEVYAKEAQLQTQVIRMQKHMSDEQLQYVKLLMDANKELGKQAIEETKLAEQKEQQNDKLVRQLQLQQEINSKTLKKGWDNNAIESFRNTNVEIGKLEAGLKNLKNLFNEINPSGVTQVSDSNITNQIQRLQEARAALEKEMQGTPGGATQEQQNKFNELTNAINNAEAAYKKLKEVCGEPVKGFVEVNTKIDEQKVALEDCQKAVNQASTATQDLGKKQLVMAGQAGKGGAALMDMGQKAQEEGAQVEGATQAVDRHGASCSNVTGQVNRAGGAMMDFGTKVSIAAAAITTVNSLVNNFSEIVNGEFDNPLDAIEATSHLLIGSLPSILIFLSRIATTGLKLTQIVPPLLAVTAVIAGAKLAFDLFKKSQENIYNRSAEARYARMQKATEDEKQKLEELKAEAESLKETWDTYESVVQTLEDCTKYSQEWRDALLQVNGAVSDMIRQYPQLLTMQKEVDGELQNAVYYEDGVTKVREWAIEQLKTENQQMQIKHQTALAYVDKVREEANLQKQTKDFLGEDSAETYFSDLGKAFGDSFSQSLKDNVEIVKDRFNGVYDDDYIDAEVDEYGRKNMQQYKELMNEGYSYTQFGDQQFYEKRSPAYEYLLQSKNGSKYQNLELQEMTGTMPEYDENGAILKNTPQWQRLTDSNSLSDLFYDDSSRGTIEGQREKLDDFLETIGTHIQDVFVKSSSDILPILEKFETQEIDFNEAISQLTNVFEASGLRFMDNDKNVTKDVLSGILNEEMLSTIIKSSGDGEGYSQILEFIQKDQQNQALIEQNNRDVAAGIIANNATAMATENFDALLEHGGDIFGAMIDPIIEKNMEILKDNSEGTTKLIADYFKANGIDYKAGSIKYSESDDLITYTDLEGTKHEKEISGEVVAAFMAAEEGVDSFTTTILENSKRISELTEAGRIKSAEFLAHGNFNNVALGSFNKNGQISDENTMKIIRNITGKEGIKEIADIDDQTAQTVGFNTGQELFDAIQQGYKDAADKKAEVLTNLEVLNEDALNTITLNTANQLSQNVSKLSIGPMGAEAGKSYLNAFNDIISAGSADQRKAISEAFLQVDWTQGTDAISNLNNLLEEQGIYLDLTSTGLEKYVGELEGASYAVGKFTEDKEAFGEVIKILQGISEVGSTISNEEYEVLAQVLGDIDDYFIQIDNDQKKLIKDLNEISLEELKTQVEDLNKNQDTWDKYTKGIDHSDFAYDEEGFDKAKFKEQLADQTSDLYHIAEQVLGETNGELLNGILKGSEEQLAELASQMMNWYNIGLTRGFNTDEQKQMLLSLAKTTTEAKKLADVVGGDLVESYEKFLGLQEGGIKNFEDAGNFANAWFGLDPDEFANKMAEVFGADPSETINVNWQDPEFLEKFYTAVTKVEGEVQVTGLEWKDFASTVASTVVKSPSLDSFKQNFQELSGLLGNKVSIGDTISAAGFEDLLKIFPEMEEQLRDSFVKIDDNTYQLYQNEELLRGKMGEVVEVFKEYQKVIDSVNENIKGQDQNLITFLNDLTEEDIKNEEPSKLLNYIDAITEGLEPEQIDLINQSIKSLGVNLDDLESYNGDQLVTVLEGIKSFLMHDYSDVDGMWNMYANLLNMEEVEKEIGDILQENNWTISETGEIIGENGKAIEDSEIPPLLKALGIRKQILEKTEELKNLENTLSKAQDTESYYDSDRKQFYQDAKVQADSYYDSKRDKDGNLNEEDSKAYAETLREIGKGLAEIDGKSVNTVEGLKRVGRSVKEAFEDSNGEIDPSNIKAYNDVMTDLILNCKDLTLDEQFELINELGIDLNSVLEKTDKLINNILGNEQTSTIEKIRELLALVNSTDMDSSEAASAIAQAVDQDDTRDISEKQDLFNTMVSKTPVKPQKSDFMGPDSSMGAIDPGDSSGLKSFDMEGYQASLESYNQAMDVSNTKMAAYEEWLSKISGHDFSSMDQLRDFVDNIPDLGELQNIFNEEDAMVEYASGIDRCSEAVHRYNQLTAQGKDASEELFNMDYLSRVEDAAKAHDLDGDRLQALAEAYKEASQAGTENYDGTLGVIEVEGDAEESAKRLAEAMTDQAVRQLRYNRGIEEGQKGLKDYGDTLSKFNSISKQGQKVTADMIEDTEDYSKAMNFGKKTMADLLNVEQKMLKDDFVSKHWDKALAAMEDAEGAAEALQQAYGEDLRDSLKETFEDAGSMEGLNEASQAAMQDMDAAYADFANKMSGLADGAIIPDLQTDPFINALVQAELAAGSTAEEIEAKLQGLGVDCDVTPLTTSLDEAVAASENAGDAIIGNASIDAEANTETVDAKDEKTMVGFDVSENDGADITFNIPKVKAGTIPGGTATIPEPDGTETLTGHVNGVTVTPKPETETEDKSQTITGVKLSNAHKSAGGKTSSGNKGGGGGGGGKGGCFVAGTLIAIGNTYKNIENIQVGDIVLSYNEKLKKNEYSVVLQTMIHHVYGNIYTLYIEDEKLIVTGIHRFLIIDDNYSRWIAAENLQIGDKVLFADGTIHSISKIDVELKVETVYNFEVSNNHNYYVGKNKILAHNKGGGKKGGGGGKAKTTTKRVASSHEDNRERYRPIVQQLEKLNNSYTDVGKAQELAFGKKHLKNLQESIRLQDQIIKQQAVYRKEIADNVKQDTENIKKQQLKNNTSKYGNAAYQNSTLKFKKGNLKITEKTNFATADISSATYGDHKLTDKDVQIDNGVITNYNDLVYAADASFNDWVNKEYSKYNENLKYNGKNKKKVKANNALKNEYERRKAIHDQFLANLAQLEETLQLQAQQITAAIENEITQIQNRIDTALYTVNIKLEIDNSELERLDFLMSTLRDDARDAAAYIAKSAEKMAIWEQQAADNLEGMSKIIGTIANNDNLKFIEDNNGKKQWFNKEDLENDEIDDSKQFLNGTDIIEKLQSSDTTVSQQAIDALKTSKALTTKQLDELSERANDQLTYVQNIHSEWINMYSRMSSAISEYSQEMDTVIEKQEHNNTLMESYRNAVELIGRSNFYKSDANGTSRAKGRDLEAQMDEQTQKARVAQIGTYQEQLKNVQEDIRIFTERRDDIAKKGLDNAEVKRSYDEYNKIIAEREEKEREINENIAASFEEALQSNLDAWQRSMQRITEEFEEALAGDAVTLDYLADALERYTKINSTLVPEYEKVHQLRMLDLEAEKSINEANDPKIKQELLEIQDEITQATAKGTKMSQYELDYLRQKLELKQAEAALDDASKAKTQVSLTRDNEGNFGYVYTADDSGVADAEKNYADKIYEMQKANAEYITELQGTIVETEQDYRSRMQEIANDTTLSEETRKAKMDQLRADFDQLHRDLTGQLTLALEASRDVYGQYSEQYAAITGDLTALNVKHVENWEDTQLSLQTGIKSIDDYEDKWSKNSDSYREKMEGSMDQYKDKWEETMEAYKGKAEEGQSVTEKFAKTATTEMSKLTSEITNATTEMTTLGGKTKTALEGIAEEAKKLEDKFVGNIGNMITKASNLVENLNKVKKALIDLDPDEENTTPPPGTDPPLTQQKNNKTLKMGRRKQAQYFTRGLKISKRNLKSSRALRKYLRKKGITSDRAKKNAFFAAVARATGRRVRSVRAAQKALKKKLVNPYSSIKVYFDTGGYTGDWAGNEGRMAMLHKKEMVLNQRDTSNILSAVDMIRGISEKIDLNALAQSGALSSGLSSGINGVSNGLLEQNVHITAEFPNATDHNEITEAFNNIIGLAAQYANR